MPGVILAVLDNPREAPALLRGAACLADLVGGAAINVLIIRMPPQAAIVASEEILTERRESQIRAQEQARATALGDAVRDWQRRSGGTGRLIDVEAAAAEAVAEHGSGADFLVIGRPARNSYGMTWQTIQAALFQTDRPVLVLPPECREGFGRRIAIAWRDDDHTVSAVLAGLRCLGRVERLIVLAGQHEGAAPPAMPAMLTEHRVAAELRILAVARHAFGRALRNEARACDADMIVMGAYVRDRVRRLVPGGLTQYMLANADVPLLMRH
jgi:nucleotide-binding universal stress UspA family protein